MDPYLEGYLWPDVHQALAGKIRQQLTPLVRPHYTVRLAVYVVEDTSPEHEIGIMYPDIDILQRDTAHEVPLRSTAPASARPHAQASPTPATCALPVLAPVTVQIPYIEIRDRAHNQLITGIEILSPVNKRDPGLQTYRQKRHRLHQAGVHVLELDLLRRGTRALAHPRLPATAYCIALTRARTNITEIWAVSIRDPLPCVPVPLRPPDTDVVLDLPTALAAIYEEAAYDLSLDYTQPPPPPTFSEAEQQWLHMVVRSTEQ